MASRSVSILSSAKRTARLNCEEGRNSVISGTSCLKDAEKGNSSDFECEERRRGCKLTVAI